MSSSTRVNFSSRTEGQRKISTIIWSLPHFLTMLENEGIREFRTENSTDSKKPEGCEPKFQLKMLFLGRDNNLIEFYFLSPIPVFLKCTMTICLKRYEERALKEKDYDTVPANKWQYLTSLYKRDVRSDRENILLSDGSLQLKFQFHITNDVQIDVCNVPAAQLSNDFENLLQEGLFSDIVMKSAEGAEFKVHKAVLASRSAVLKAHFEHNTIECHTNTLESPLDTDILREVLTFVYTDKAPSVEDNAEQLLAAADYYQLGRLKSLCEEALHKKLTVENAIETLQLAALHSATTLEILTLEFIKDGNAKLIIKTEGWANVQSVELIKRIYEYIVNDEVETDIK